MDHGIAARLGIFGLADAHSAIVGVTVRTKIRAAAHVGVIVGGKYRVTVGIDQPDARVGALQQHGSRQGEARIERGVVALVNPLQQQQRLIDRAHRAEHLLRIDAGQVIDGLLGLRELELALARQVIGQPRPEDREQQHQEAGDRRFEAADLRPRADGTDHGHIRRSIRRLGPNGPRRAADARRRNERHRRPTPARSH